ncbi:endonuclease/exonuclease/phosphatase family protein [Patulibacter sp.]|uniref:endonuclease/exonuclease/phosphatase family protein n=1 Tax=Patulibacter sp. TaxID=1912859 RepID=UPI0027262481|nr:endonuclease/exonuclease/phosphatase family protein [Patulibacter sp.]MDO9409622.1 hypothetical protein [Patulibacter sp.]
MHTPAARRTSLRLPVSLVLLGALLLGALLAGPTSARAATSIPLIHINACDRAKKCAGGNATGHLTAILRSGKPELLTLNEVCSATVNRVARNTGYKKVFAQAGRAMCPGGRGKYGNAILAAPHRDLVKTVETKYSMQQGGTEKRVLLCADSSGAAVCTTHLDHLGKAVAQAGELKTLLAAQLARNPSLFFGADLNIGPPAAQRYALPAGMRRMGDGRVMHIFYSAAFGQLGGVLLRSTLTWTDHAGLALRAPAA